MCKQFFAVIAILITMSSCGTYKEVQVIKVNETAFVTLSQDTIVANKRILYNLRPNSTYGIYLKNGVCVNVKRQIK